MNIVFTKCLNNLLEDLSIDPGNNPSCKALIPSDSKQKKLSFASMPNPRAPSTEDLALTDSNIEHEVAVIHSSDHNENVQGLCWKLSFSF